MKPAEEERMEYRKIRKLLMLLSIALFFVSFIGFESSANDIRFTWCSPVMAKNKNSGPPAHDKNSGPPAHAKAHGYRAKHTYRYYPSAQAYYDVDRRAYFYLEGGKWRVSVSLPMSLKARLGEYVTIGMDSDRPYTRFDEHRKSYPPGQMKKKHGKWSVK
jgi:hypothetical protein